MPQQTFGANPHIDDSIWNASDTLDVGAMMTSSSNEFVMGIQSFVPFNSAAQWDYEKAGLIIDVATADQSYPGSKDLVAIDGRSAIWGGNTRGRVWGGCFVGHARTGGDGLLVGVECGVANNGSNQPLVDQVDSKYGILAVAGEFGAPGAGTAGLYLTGAARWHHGVISSAGALIDDFLRLNRGTSGDFSFRVEPTGEVWITSGARRGKLYANPDDNIVRFYPA